MSRRKRSLSQTGGRCVLAGDPELSARLERCLSVDPEAKLPFTHGFHAYPARMHPETARRAIEAFAGPSVLDPFLGSGTLALEAVRAGRTFMGNDLSRVAVEIAWARTRVLVPEECRRVERTGSRLASQAFTEAKRDELRPPPLAQNERSWYDPHTFREIVALKGLIDREEETLRRLLTVVLSSLVVKLSRQRSDSDQTEDPDWRPRPRGATFRWFRDKCSELTRGLLQLSSDLYKRKIPFVPPDLRQGDSRRLALGGGTVDLVVTSPPYPGTYDYARQHARRYWLFGQDPREVERDEVGSRRARGAGFAADLEACLKNALSALVPGGPMLVLLGDGIEGAKAIFAQPLLLEIAEKHGAAVLASASQRRRDWSGLSARQEHLVLMKKHP
jgi:hypothetical protein